MLKLSLSIVKIWLLIHCALAQLPRFQQTNCIFLFLFLSLCYLMSWVLNGLSGVWFSLLLRPISPSLGVQWLEKVCSLFFHKKWRLWSYPLELYSYWMILQCIIYVQYWKILIHAQFVQRLFTLLYKITCMFFLCSAKMSKEIYNFCLDKKRSTQLVSTHLLLSTVPFWYLILL